LYQNAILADAKFQF